MGRPIRTGCRAMGQQERGNNAGGVCQRSRRDKGFMNERGQGSSFFLLMGNGERYCTLLD